MDKKRIIILFLFSCIFVVGIVLSLYYYKDKYVVSFETGTDDIILNQYIKKNQKVKEPSNPTKLGYIFMYWEHNGKKFDFDSIIKENITLSAKWVKKEYIVISFDTDTLYEIDDIKILKGSNIEQLPVVEKEGYIFEGWLLNNKLYNNEKLNSNTKLKAKFTKLDEELKIGDRVYIIGPYSSSSFDNDYNTKGIGWDRIILDILNSRENPYVVGNEYGITGFFKKESLKK